MSGLDSPASMRTSPALDMLGRWVGEHPRFWIKLGNAETKLLSLDLEDIAVKAPVYVCGLARSGSTLLLEALASQPQVATHRYQDFPFLFTPYWWNKLLSINPVRDKSMHERAHGDGMLVNAESPEAMEEMLWMAFFNGRHDASRNQILDGNTQNPAFSEFYRDHIKKLLLARKRSRYLAKGNYNVTRLLYLQSLFPDARFILPVRDPVTHVESLMRQHARFTEAGKNAPRAVRHMSLAGHFEFGLNRTAINVGDTARLKEIEAAWQKGEEARGFALYWNMIYRFLHEQLQANPALKQNTLIVRYETLCAKPEESLRQLFAHAQLTADDALINRWSQSISAPDYYKSALSAEDTALIRSLTQDTAKQFGY